MSKISKNSIKFLLAGLSCMAPLSASGADLQYQNNYYIPPHGLPAPQLLPPEIKNDDNSKKASENKENSNKMQKVLSALKDKKNYNKKNIIEYGPYLGLGVILLGAGITYAASRSNKFKSLIDKKIKCCKLLLDGKPKNLIKNELKDLKNEKNKLLKKYSSEDDRKEIEAIYKGYSLDVTLALRNQLYATLNHVLSGDVTINLNEKKIITNYNMKFDITLYGRKKSLKKHYIFATIENYGCMIPVFITTKDEDPYKGASAKIHCNFLNINTEDLSECYITEVGECFKQFVNSYLGIVGAKAPSELQAIIHTMWKLVDGTMASCYLSEKSSYDVKFEVKYHDYRCFYLSGYYRSGSNKIAELKI